MRNLLRSFQAKEMQTLVNFKLIIDKAELCAYLTKYVTKAEPYTESLLSFIKNKLESTDRSAESILKGCVISILGGRDISKQWLALFF